MNMERIRELCGKRAFRWTSHILTRLLQRGIGMDDIESCLLSGEIIEQYLDDYPSPSCLVLGATVNKKALHVVCGIGDGEIWLITAYYPNPDEWADGFRVRRESDI